MIGDDDGWRLKTFEGKSPVCLSLYLELKVGGDLLAQYSRRVWHSLTVDDVTRGEMSRWQCLWEAVARFLNAGGRFSDLRDISQPQLDLLPEIAIPGFHLLATEQSLDLAMPTHLFAADNPGDERLIVWTEDVAIEMSTVEAENSHREEAEDDRANL